MLIELILVLIVKLIIVMFSSLNVKSEYHQKKNISFYFGECIIVLICIKDSCSNLGIIKNLIFYLYTMYGLRKCVKLTRGGL